MGLISSFFERRRQRESAIPQADEPSPIPSAGAVELEPVGQPVKGVGQPFNLNLGSGQPDVAGILGMVGQALSSGQFQIQQTDRQTIDLRGTPDGQALREQIESAMRQAGVDPDSTPAGANVNAADYGDLQQQILQTLQSHGVDVSGVNALPPDTDGDGQPD